MKKISAVLLASLAFVALGATASAQTGDRQRFIVIGTGSNGDETSTVIAVGPISGVGTFEETEDPDVVRFVFDEGTVTLLVPTEEESDDFDERTCTGSFRFSGPWEIIDATGEFAGATGSGTYRGQGRFVGERVDGGCSEEGGFFFFHVTATGTVAFDDAVAA